MIIVYSGGMDSTVLLHEYREIKLAVTFNYGSKHNDMEFLYAQKNCQHLGIEHIRVDLREAMFHFKSDLLKTGGEIPEGHYEEESMKKTVVPFRNGIMLSIAAGLAESRNIKQVLVANHFGDHAIYPDCRKDFIVAMMQAIVKGTWANIKLTSPYVDMTKREIALRGKALGVNFANTYSCYKGQEIHCGKCGTCTERKEALQGFDPTQYASSTDIR